VEKYLIVVLLLAISLSAICEEEWKQPESMMAKPVWSDVNRKSMFPQANPPADIIYALDISTIDVNDRILLTTAQGLINRDTPQLFLYSSVSDTTFSEEKDWLKWLYENGYIKETKEISTFEDILKKWDINEVILIDPNLPASINIATMMAGFENIPAAYAETVEKYNLKVKIDLEGRWQSNVDAYKWAFDNYWDRMDHTTVAWYASMREYSHLRDYLVSKKIFTFWVTGPKDGNPVNSNKKEEKKFIQELMVKKIPVGIPVMGFPWASDEEGVGEQEGVAVMSRSGKFHVCNNLRPNLSLWTGLKSKKSEYKQLPPHNLKLEKDKIYVTLIMSDGDNMNTWFNWFPKYWRSPIHGQIPVGWTMGPTIIDMQAPLLDFYFDNIKKTDSIGCAVSGAGYMFATGFAMDYKPEYREKIWLEYQNITERYMRKLDMNWLHVFRKFEVPREQVPLHRYTDIPSIKTIFCGYGGQANYPESHLILGDRVVFYPLDVGEGYDTLNGILAQVPDEGPAFFNIFLYNWGWSYDYIKMLVDHLPENFVVVRPGELTLLYKEHLKQYVATPRATPSPSKLFVDEKVKCELSSDTEGAGIHYTIDGSEPTLNSPLYKEPINISESVHIKAKAYGENRNPSHTTHVFYTLISSRDGYGLKYTYYEGDWLELPDFDRITPLRQGTVYNFDIRPVEKREDHFAIKFQGYIDISQSGRYTFYTISDDGSKLYINGQQVVNNDGSHSAQIKSGWIELEKGRHSIVVTYFEDSMEQSFQVLYEGPGIEKQIIPANVLYPEKKE